MGWKKQKHSLFSSKMKNCIKIDHCVFVRRQQKFDNLDNSKHCDFFLGLMKDMGFDKYIYNNKFTINER